MDELSKNSQFTFATKFSNILPINFTSVGAAYAVFFHIQSSSNTDKQNTFKWMHRVYHLAAYLWFALDTKTVCEQTLKNS